ncbi:cation diffusion facilitator family transporter [Pajaroellobacter abortibovis]|uniref:Cobalt transporter n=1 Tax=Pajaroellobacter abortibovis TaxID=1882918 RepID=A0A1L6MWZ7_9BACT|nr:cation diffusion facilitator family transporter [Pajaroellobacter abortibovis]APS00067.1 cobalt transporter [Pajaroellobacter abortibovis]
MEHHHHHSEVTEGIKKGQAFAIGIALNTLFIGIEFTYGLISRSVSLVADAAHNLGDVLGLALAWGATVLARQKPSHRRTYGFQKTTIIAALVNALLILVATGGVAWEAIKRLLAPRSVQGEIVTEIALLGVIINGGTALLFLQGKKRDANMRGVFLHLMADTGISLGVMMGGLLISKTGWLWIDPVVSLGVSVAIWVSTWSLLREAIDLSLDAVPGHIDFKKVQHYLTSLPGVCDVHDLHIWSMSTTEVALTAHLVMCSIEDPRFLAKVSSSLHDRFSIEHTTLQVESVDSPTPCIFSCHSLARFN